MSHMMFFLPSTFRFCPLLKNDGRGELHLRKAVSYFSPSKRKNTNCKPSPLVGEVVNRQVDRKDKAENKRKTVLQNGTKYLPVILERS